LARIRRVLAQKQQHPGPLPPGCYTLCLFSLARASSFGMNLFRRLDYRYRGTLINNCHISGAYEDMNTWVKNVR